MEKSMNGMVGIEKFSHLEDKIYLTIEFAKKMREAKDKLEQEIGDLRKEISKLMAEKECLEDRVGSLIDERDAIQLKVEAMLDAITLIEPEVSKVLRG